MIISRSSRHACAKIVSKPYICSSCLHRALDQPLTRQHSSTNNVVPSRPIHTTGSFRFKEEAKALKEEDEFEQSSWTHGVPLRKVLKDLAKRKRVEQKAQKDTSSGSDQTRSRSQRADREQKWELTVGIEIHAELDTARKLFSRASATASLSEFPNSHVALFDAAMPGAQPQFQKETLIPAIRAALALGCEVQRRSRFDRKHYFYQDQPNGYQITQFYEPFAKDGSITLFPHDFPGGVIPEYEGHDGGPLTIGIKQVQMEQDTAKTISNPPYTHFLDFNRVSHPLIEIITLPQIHHPLVAAACVKKIQALLKAVGSVTAGMEMGGLRADVNVSVRQRSDDSGAGHSYSGVTGLGQRTEIKNLASIKAVEDAIIAERDRQIDILEADGVIEGETRAYTLGEKTTRRLRGKEGEIDYRYMPDPDIPPIFIGEDVIQYLRGSLPATADDWMKILTTNAAYSLTPKDANTLLSLDGGGRVDYYLDVVSILQQTLSEEVGLGDKIGKTAGNWVLMELGGLFKNEVWDPRRVPAAHLASIIAHLLRTQITGKTAKMLLATVFDHHEQYSGCTTAIEDIIRERNLLLKPLSRDGYEALARSLLEEKKDVVRDIVQKGQVKKIKWFLGQMMARAEQGTVVPATAEEVLVDLLKSDYGLKR